MNQEHSFINRASPGLMASKASYRLISEQLSCSFESDKRSRDVLDLWALQCFCSSNDHIPDFHTAFERNQKVIKDTPEHKYPSENLSKHTCMHMCHTSGLKSSQIPPMEEHELILLNANSNRGCYQLHYPRNPVQTVSVKSNGLPDLAKMVLLRFFLLPGSSWATVNEPYPWQELKFKASYLLTSDFKEERLWAWRCRRVCVIKRRYKSN